MGVRNLPHQRQAQAESFAHRSSARRTIEGFEYLPTFLIGNSDTTVVNVQLHVARAGSADVNARRTACMTLRIVQEVAHHPPQEARVTTNSDRLSFNRPIEVGGFLGHERE